MILLVLFLMVLGSKGLEQTNTQPGDNSMEAMLEKIVNNDVSSETLESLKYLDKLKRGVRTLHFLTQEDTIPAMSLQDLIRYWGYPLEEHFVTTEDGYILGLHRIPHGRNNSDLPGQRPVVYLQHGLLHSSASWSQGPPHKSLGYLLADLGYDVWMGNNRGNTFSRNHTSFDPCSSCPEFWNFSWHEGGIYDIPACIDYVLNYTNQDKLHYVGHSMGTTQFLVMASSKPEYNEKIKAAALMAPPAFMSHATNFIFELASIGNDLEVLLHLFGVYEFLPHNDLISFLGHLLCGDDLIPENPLCVSIAFLLFGFTPGQLNETMIPTYTDFIPAGSSVGPFLHYAQLHLAGKFQAFDYGKDNMDHYGQDSPPEYNLDQITAPLAIFKADHDSLVDYEDINYLVSRLPNVVMDHMVEMHNWNHLDYIVAMEADKVVYKYVIDIIAAYP